MITLFEVRRQLFHAFLGLVIVLLYYFELISPLLIFIILLFGGFLCLLSKKVKIPLIAFFLRNLEREEQRKLFPGRGVLFYFIGVLLTMKLFPKEIALASITILALGDSVSHLIGEGFGKLQNFFNLKGRKWLEGTLAGAFLAFWGAWVFVPFHLALLGSFGAMIVEALELELNKKPIDDNLLVPLAAGTIMLLIKTYL